MNNTAKLKDPLLNEEQLLHPLYNEVHNWLQNVAKLKIGDDDDIIECYSVVNKRKANRLEGTTNAQYEHSQSEQK